MSAAQHRVAKQQAKRVNPLAGTQTTIEYNCSVSSFLCWFRNEWCTFLVPGNCVQVLLVDDSGQLALRLHMLLLLLSVPGNHTQMTASPGAHQDSPELKRHAAKAEV